MLNSQLTPAREVLQQVLSEIDFSLKTVTSGSEIERLLNVTVLNGGKRFRPTLLALFGKFFGLTFEGLIPYARAVEMTHAATLAHDDVIDEASMRRDIRTLNSLSSNSHAVLGGDFLLARAIAEIAELRAVEIIRDMAQVLQELVSGEWLQLEARGIVDVQPRHLETVAEKKTASLIAWCCTTPARLAHGSPELIEYCRAFGTKAGLAFQQMDDLLDYEPGTGKAVAKDFREGLVNFVLCELLRQFPEQRNTVASTIGTDAALPWNESQLRAARDSVLESVMKNISEAETLLDTIEDRARLDGIRINMEGATGLREVLAGIALRSK